MSFKVLVVDDEAPVLEVMKANLEPLGAEVHATSESQEAARLVDAQKFDGVFLDVRMPAPDGFELTRRIRASAVNSRVPIVLLTGLDDAETMRQGFKAGATFFLGKPITRDRIENLFNAIAGPMMSDRRRQVRLPFRTAVKCVWMSTRENNFMAESLNIGEGGMLLRPSGGLAADQALVLEFTMPASSRLLRMKAKIIRREPPDSIAVEFQGISILDREAIQSYIVGRLKE